MPDQFDAFFNPKNASEKNAKNITPPSIGQLEKGEGYDLREPKAAYPVVCLDAKEFRVVFPCSGSGSSHGSWWPSFFG